MYCCLSVLRPSVWRSNVYLCLTNVFPRMFELSINIRQTKSRAALKVLEPTITQDPSVRRRLFLCSTFSRSNRI